MNTKKLQHLVFKIQLLAWTLRYIIAQRTYSYIKLSINLVLLIVIQFWFLNIKIVKIYNENTFVDGNVLLPKRICRLKKKKLDLLFVRIYSWEYILHNNIISSPKSVHFKLPFNIHFLIWTYIVLILIFI